MGNVDPFAGPFTKINFLCFECCSFCGRHGPQAQEPKPSAPDDLMCLPNTVMPRLIFRLIQHMRDYSTSPATVTNDADGFLSMLQDFSAMGAAMRRVMTRALTDPQVSIFKKKKIGCFAQEKTLHLIFFLGL